MSRGFIQFIRTGVWSGAALGIVTAFVLQTTLVHAQAQRYTSPNYVIDASNLGSSMGGATSSGSYKMYSTGGESIAGNGASSSYRLAGGYIAQLENVPAIQMAIQPSGLSRYYAFDETTPASLYDSSANGDVGTATGAPSFAAGKLNNSLVLNGSTQYASAGITVSNPTTFTISTWFRTSTTSGGKLIGLGSSQTGASASADRHLYMNNSGHIYFGVNPGSIKTITNGVAYNNNQWHLATATLSASGMILYIDGVQVATDAATTSAQNFTGYWRFGYDVLSGWTSAPTSSFFNGSLDEAKVFTRALTADEVRAEYNAGNAGAQGGVALGSVTPGTSQVALYDAIVKASTNAYSLSVNQSANLTKGSDTIPGISGSIASPQAWVEASTKGLGFTLLSGVGIDSKWNSGASYAALPGSSTSFYSRTGYTPGTRDVLGMRLRLDVAASQVSGAYQNNMTITGTTTP